MRITYTGVGLFWIWLFVNAFTLSAQEKLELSTSYPQKVDNFTLTITFHIDVWVNPQLAEMLIFLEIFNILA